MDENFKTSHFDVIDSFLATIELVNYICIIVYYACMFLILKGTPGRIITEFNRCNSMINSTFVQKSYG